MSSSLRFEKEVGTLPKTEQSDIRKLIAHLQQEREDARKPMLMLFAELEETGFERNVFDILPDILKNLHQSPPTRFI